MEWISVGERLPEDEGVYLVYVASAEPLRVMIDYRLESGWLINPHWGQDITHWMPLPPPPTEPRPPAATITEPLEPPTPDVQRDIEAQVEGIVGHYRRF